MAQTLSLRVGDSYYLDVSASVDARRVGTPRTVASSDETKVAVEKIDDYRYRLAALAAGSATVTASVGAVTDAVTVTVIAADAVTSVAIHLVGQG